MNRTAEVVATFVVLHRQRETLSPADAALYEALRRQLQVALAQQSTFSGRP